MSPLYVGGAIDYGNKSSAPTSPAPTEGSMYYHTGQDKNIFMMDLIGQVLMLVDLIQVVLLLIGGLKLVCLIMMDGMLQKVVRIFSVIKMMH